MYVADPAWQLFCEDLTYMKEATGIDSKFFKGGANGQRKSFL